MQRLATMVKGLGPADLEPPLVVVVGGAVVDVVGKSAASEAATLHTSQQGETWTKDGGVGRNIAEGVARLGVPTRFVGTVGDDDAGGVVRRNLTAAGVDASAVKTVHNTATATYQCILSSDGGLVAAVADMRTHDAIDSSYLRAPFAVRPSHRRTAITMLCFDANIRGDVMATLLDLPVLSPATVVVHEPTSVPKSVRCVPLLPRVDVLTPNDFELFAMADALAPEGHPRHDDVPSSAAKVLAAGALFVVVTLGAEGVRVYTKAPAEARTAKWTQLWQGDAPRAPPHKLLDGGLLEARLAALPVDRILDVTGAGDSLTAGLVAGVARGLSVVDSIHRVGLHAARSTLKSKRSVSEHLMRDAGMALHIER
eukprot:TRINITY_DN10145_c0_g1_i1.p1 TRINITY_DN10145_c0_g1~~TRINITY_DN10145_c0_g1_i1.p1  ORF type:complete len:410 (+),score=111.17 TRINITY_DN10145_c0_g1_i1:126-1232(+)